MKISLNQIFTLVLFTLLLASCGKRPQIVTGIQVAASNADSELMLSFKADVDLGNMSFPSLILPILHPRGQTPIGSVELLPVLGGKNQVLIKLNLSELADLEPSVATLPNGNTIPLIANNPTVALPIGNGGYIYLTASGKILALGVAIPIRTFDQIGQSVGGVNFFPHFTMGNIQGAAGLFTSAMAGQNGFALVADLSSAVTLPDPAAPLLGDLGAAQFQEELSEMKLNLVEHLPARAKEERINRILIDLNRRGKRLEIRR